MFLISDTKEEILLLLHGDKIASIEKQDIEDFTTLESEHNGLIDFQTKSGKQVRFAIPEGEQFDKGIAKLINITDGMGI